MQSVAPTDVNVVVFFTLAYIPMVDFMESGELIKMNKLKDYFELNRVYRFEVTDLTAFIYTICAIGGMMGVDMTILWCIGATIATAFCWQARRINLVVLNGALWIMNMYNLITM